MTPRPVSLPRLRYAFMVWFQRGFAPARPPGAPFARLQLELLEERNATNNLCCVALPVEGITAAGLPDLPEASAYQTYATADVSNLGGGRRTRAA